jgi:CubicO group peptidase (beta-lactamase class C family)
VSGHAGVLEFGQSTNLSAKALGVGELAELEWTLLEGPGVLLPTGPGTATFVAPSSAPGPLGITKIGLAPIGCPGQGVELGLHYSAPPMPWVTGPAVAAFASVDSRLMQFMYDRCTGGAVVAVNWKGVPIIRRGYGRDRGRSTPGRPAVSCGPADPEALPVWPDSPVRVGSNSKALSAAMLRKTVESRLLAYGRRPDPDDYDTDAAFRAAVDQAVENVRILDAQLNLLPIGMRMHLGSCTFTGSSPLDNQYTCSNGGTPPPVVVPITGNGAPANCSGNPCFNGGNCAINPQGNAVCACPQGFTGGRCRQLTGGSNLAPNGVDRRWQNITVGHLLTHTSGLPNGIESQDLALANIEALRGRHDPAFSIPEDIGPFLHDYSPSLQEPGPGEPDSYFLEDRPSTFEFIWLQAGRNLDYAPGAVSVYSNLGFILIGAILDYTSAQLGWAAGDTWGGAPDSHLDHAGSRVDGFVRVYLGGRPGDTNPWGATRSRYGMFLARSPDPSAAPFSQTDPFELQPRDWVNGVLNPPQEDRKGNVCEYSAQTGCTWKSGIIDYFGNPGLVPYGLNGNLISAAAGGLVTEAHLYLRFMAAFTVGYSSTFPGYGRPRVGWQQASSHNGEWVGAKAHARQVGWRTNGASCTHRKVLCNPGDPLATCCPQGGTCCAANFDCVTGGRPSFPVNAVDTSQNECVSLQTYVIPTVNNTTGDYSPKANTNTTGGCVLPEGLDIFVASNQTSDAQDVDGTDYDYLQDAVIRGLCEVNWPLNPWLIAPGNHKLPAFSP